VESWKPHLAGFVVRHRSRRASNFRADEKLEDYLVRSGVPAMEGIDTRALVRRIRTQGAMKGVLSTIDLDDGSLVAKAKASPGLVGRDLVREVLPAKSIDWQSGLHPLSRLVSMGRLVPQASLEPMANLDPLTKLYSPSAAVTFGGDGPKRPHVVALDYGLKWNIARHLFDMGCRVTILAGTATAEEVLALEPDGVFLSNGPGDPEPLYQAQETIRGLLGKKPIFGICLGHQLLALACGAKTYKLKFGHRGANQPVLNKQTGQVEITCQNHGFAVDVETLPAELQVTHINLNDNTVEGMRHTRFAAFSVQYHPEASAGPHDSSYLFAQFGAMLK
jgi:carbamoyl-phosphate synthase small subunit